MGRILNNHTMNWICIAGKCMNGTVILKTEEVTRTFKTEVMKKTIIALSVLASAILYSCDSGSGNDTGTGSDSAMYRDSTYQQENSNYPQPNNPDVNNTPDTTNTGTGGSGAGGTGTGTDTATRGSGSAATGSTGGRSQVGSSDTSKRQRQ